MALLTTLRDGSLAPSLLQRITEPMSDRWPALLRAPLSGSLAARDRNGAQTLTGSGAVRYQAGPNARTNYAHNPRFANDVTGWTTSTATLTRIASDSTLGGTCGELVATATTGAGARTNLFAATNRIAKTAHTFSFDAYLVSGAADWRVYVTEWDAAGALLGNTVVSTFTVTSSLQRFSVTYTPSVTGVHVVHFGISRVTAAVSTVRFSNIVIESGTIASPTYFDGTSLNAAWLDPITGILGTAHASPSVSHAAAWVEEGTTNVLTNPSFETDASTGWTDLTSGGTVTRTRDTTYARNGSASMKVVTDGGSIQGATSNVSSTTTAGQVWTGTLYVRGSGNARILIRESTGAASFTSATVATSDSWQRMTVTHTVIEASTTVYLRVDSETAKVMTFYVDSAQLEQKSYATSYADGAIGTGYTWSGTAHASSSTRAATSATISATGRMSTTKGSFYTWVNVAPSGVRNQYALNLGDYGSPNDFIGVVARLAGSNPRLWLRSNGVDTTLDWGSSLASNTWVRLYADWTASTARLSVGVGGAFVTTSSRQAPTGTPQSNTTIYVGQFGSFYLNGAMVPAVTYDRPLTDAEIARLDAIGPASVRFDTIRDAS